MSKKVCFILIPIILPICFLYGQSSLDRIAILNLEPVSISNSESITLSDRLRSELVNSGAFTVIERSEVDEILQEQGFQNSGCTSDECAVEIGKLLNIDRICAGSVGKVGSLYTIALRMIDIETGQIVVTVNEDCRCPIEEVLTASIKNIVQKLVDSNNKSNNPELIDKRNIKSKNEMYDGNVQQKSKMNALIRSAILPGWGQYYQEKPIQTWLYPVLFSGGAIASYLMIDSYNNAVTDFEKAEELYLNALTFDEIERTGSALDKAYKDIESKERTRNIMFIATGAIWLWNVLDTIVLQSEYKNKKVITAKIDKNKIIAELTIDF